MRLQRRPVELLALAGLDDRGHRLAVALVGDADHEDVEDRLGDLIALSTSSGKTFSPPVLTHVLPRPSRVNVPSSSIRA